MCWNANHDWECFWSWSCIAEQLTNCGVTWTELLTYLSLLDNCWVEAALRSISLAFFILFCCLLGFSTSIKWDTPFFFFVCKNKKQSTKQRMMTNKHSCDSRWQYFRHMRQSMICKENNMQQGWYLMIVQSAEMSENCVRQPDWLLLVHVRWVTFWTKFPLPSL